MLTVILAIGLIQDFRPLDNAHAERTKKKPLETLLYLKAYIEKKAATYSPTLHCLSLIHI